MPRTARRISDSGFYHVISRGVGRMALFLDDEDRRFFLDGLLRACRGTRCAIIAWCLMDNHVHLIVSDGDGSLSKVMHRAQVRYAAYFLRRTGHVGHVFESRFKSKPIEDDGYLLAAVRYVHLNPWKAGICEASRYGWSSYREYAAEPMGDPLGEPMICDRGPVLELLGGPAAFRDLIDGRWDLPAYDPPRAGTRVSDDDMFDVAAVALGDIDPEAIRALDAGGRRRALGRLRDAGLSVRQIQFLTRLSGKTITRATTSLDPA